MRCKQPPSSAATCRTVMYWTPRDSAKTVEKHVWGDFSADRINRRQMLTKHMARGHVFVKGCCRKMLPEHHLVYLDLFGMGFPICVFRGSKRPRFRNLPRNDAFKHPHRVNAWLIRSTICWPFLTVVRGSKVSQTECAPAIRHTLLEHVPRPEDIYRRWLVFPCPHIPLESDT